MLEIIAETPAIHAEEIEALYDSTFGPGHFAKTAERLREGTVSIPNLNRVAVLDGKVIAACRLWPVEVGEAQIPAVFVGPVAVAPGFQGQRLGLSVTGKALEAAAEAGWEAAVIIGSPRYFSEIGFDVVSKGQLRFPGPQDPARIMVRSLAGNAAELSGRVKVPVEPGKYL